jgi:catechol 2,3-dioxygenase-like lactoylglutathione lyase family enzyme
MILGVHHPALAVPDMRRAREFYCGVLGFEVAMEAEIPSGVPPLDAAFGVADAGCKVCLLRKGNTCIELFEFAAGEPGEPRRPVNRHGITHLALASDDYAKDYDHLAANGVVFNTPPMGEAPSRWAYGRDPFGNVIELLENVAANPIALRFDDGR